MSRIDAYLDALESAFSSAGNIVPWPIPVASIFPYFSDLEAADLYSKLKTLSRRPDATHIVSGLLTGVSVTKATLADLVIGMKAANPPIPATERVWYAEYIFDVLAASQAGDIFARDGTNRLLTDDDAQELVSQRSWHSLPASSDFAKAAYKVSASAQALIWALYFYGWTDVGFEIHGPYSVRAPDGSPAHMVVRDFFDVRPALLWPAVEQFPYATIRVMTLHQQSSDMRVDIFNHLFQTGSMLDTTLAVYVDAGDAEVSSVGQAETVAEHILRQVGEQHHTIREMSRTDVIAKFIECRYYAFRKWRTHFGEDWRPPANVMQRLREWGPIELADSDNPEWAVLRAAFDPRTDVVPGPSNE